MLYDTYLIEELPCASNEDKVTLEPFQVTISRHMVTVDLGTVTNDYKPKPEIGTTATDKETGEHDAYTKEETTIIDTVSYENLTPGLEYTIKGILMDKETGNPLLINETEITAQKTFVPPNAKGKVELEFTFNSSALKGKKIVVYETVYYEGREIAVHADIEDEGQTITFYDPKIGTTATDEETGGHGGYTNEITTITDVIVYENLIPGKKYTIQGILMDKTSGNPLLIHGEEITAVKAFTPSNTNGSVELKFTFDSSALKGKQVVAFETVYYESREIAVHADIKDENQAVAFYDPELGTTATNAETGEQYGYVSETTTILDAVAYKNLIPGETYTIKGILMNKEIKKPLLVNGKEVTAEKTFLASKESGSVELKFTFDSSALKGKEIVVFETLYYKEREVAAHADLKDKGQTVAFQAPEIKTTATDTETGEHSGYVNEVTMLVDEVKYENLIPGKEYTIKGILMDKETGDPLLVNDKVITAEKTFIPSSAKGTEELEFTFDSSALKGKKAVVFEGLYYEGREIAIHADIEDENQTVEYYDPKIETTAKDKTTGGHSGYVSALTTIVDEVTYENLIPGKEYTIKGILMNKENGKSLLVNSKEITAEKTFTAKKAKGSVELKFIFDSSALKGKQVVAFETVYYRERIIATHADIKDSSQTVEFMNPKLGTAASEKNTGKKEIKAEREVTIVDTVTYKNLIPGKEYTLKGILMDKGTGEPLLVNGNEITAEKIFMHNTASGSVEMEFSFNASALQGKEVVVFEGLYYGENEIAVHMDIADEGQTVKFVDKESPNTPFTPKTPILPKTGDTKNIVLWLLLALASIWGGTVAFIYWKKRH